MSNESNNLNNKVAEWLGKEGYRLEYITHKAFSDTGLTTVMSNYVETPEGSWREIDVTAMQQPDYGLAKPTAVRIMCECKYSVEKPWVLLQTGLMSNIWCDWISLPQSPDLKEFTKHIEHYEKQLHSCWHFAKEQYFAHNLVQAFREKNRDVAFESLQKISNAAWDYVETPNRRGHSAYLIAIPSLVVEAPIYSAWFDNSKYKFIAKEVKYGRLSWSGCRGGTLVDIVQAGAINEYAEVVRNSIAIILNVLVDLQARITPDTQNGMAYG